MRDEALQVVGPELRASMAQLEAMQQQLSAQDNAQETLREEETYP